MRLHTFTGTLPGFVLAWIILLSTSHGFAATPVVVGFYNFPPVAQVAGPGELSGLVGDLLALLNQNQDQFHFTSFETSAKRRQLDLQHKLYDVIFFESLDWSWREQPVQYTKSLLLDEEVYVALKKPWRDQSFFDDIAQRRIVAMLGYHYGFTDYNTDETSLRKRFHIELSHSHRRNLQLILVDRPSIAEVAVVSRSFLQQYLANYPQYRDKLLVSEKIDQRYRLKALTRENGPITAQQVMELLHPLIQDGRYQALVKKWGLQLPPEVKGGIHQTAGTPSRERASEHPD